MIDITIFTPVYNRYDELDIVYDSLVNQTCKEFKWLIVDDGSNPKLEDKVNKFIDEKLINIKYVYQNNSGKHVAFNTAIDICDTNYIFCLDSDDYLGIDAVEKMYYMVPLLNAEDLIGFVSHRDRKDNLLKLKDFNRYKLVEIVTSSKKTLELAIFFKASWLKKNKFPVFDGERFLSEEVVYNELDKKGYYLYYNYAFLHGDYMEGGLTANINKLWMNNPQGTLLLLQSRYKSFDFLESKRKIYRKIRCCLVYSAFCIANGGKNFFKFPNTFVLVLCFPLSILVYYQKFRRGKL